MNLGNASRIKARSAKTFIPMSENEKAFIKNFNLVEKIGLKLILDSTKTIKTKNVWRQKAKRIRQMIKQQEKIGSFPPGYSN